MSTAEALQRVASVSGKVAEADPSAAGGAGSRRGLRIEDYALIGDTQTAALVGRDGSIDWLCLPRFDSGACFAALLGDRSNGRWRLAPAGAENARVERRYVPGTLVLESLFTTPSGVVRVVDCMPVRGVAPDVVRVVEGVTGTVSMSMDLVARFDYGSIRPWTRQLDGVVSAVAGPDALELVADVPVAIDDDAVTAEFLVREGDRVSFVLTWHPSAQPAPGPADRSRAVSETVDWWQAWSGRCEAGGVWADDVRASLVVLKALTYAPTGGLVAAATTSLPEVIGGVRNWDYRFCWLRDATFTLQALLTAGYEAEAVAWRDWLLRAVAGDPAQLQIMYGVGGERRLPELELAWLPGYEGSTPVRIGNAATGQRQLDVYGEVMDSLHQARLAGIDPDSAAWGVQRAMMDWLESGWREPDYGLWEVRGDPRHFVHSKVMCWVAFDRAVRAVERFGLTGPADRWRSSRDEIHREVCTQGWDADRATFTQSYGSATLDASLLMIPMLGFLHPSDPRVASTVEAVQRELTVDGFVERYPTGRHAGVDGLPGREGTFLLCSFWLADALTLIGRTGEARRLFERLVGLTNDVGLLAEEYDPVSKRMLGNVPQAFSHVGLVNTAFNLTAATGPATRRREA
jgi:GH15 family glucan-1,4-alpha-glucosidase